MKQSAKALLVFLCFSLTPFNASSQDISVIEGTLGYRFSNDLLYLYEVLTDIHNQNADLSEEEIISKIRVPEYPRQQFILSHQAKLKLEDIDQNLELYMESDNSFVASMSKNFKKQLEININHEQTRMDIYKMVRSAKTEEDYRLIASLIRQAKMNGETFQAILISTTSVVFKTLLTLPMGPELETTVVENMKMLARVDQKWPQLGQEAQSLPSNLEAVLLMIRESLSQV